MTRRPRRLLSLGPFSTPSFICPVMPQKTHVGTANHPSSCPQILLRNHKNGEGCRRRTNLSRRTWTRIPMDARLTHFIASPLADVAVRGESCRSWMRARWVTPPRRLLPSAQFSSASQCVIIKSNSPRASRHHRVTTRPENTFSNKNYFGFSRIASVKSEMAVSRLPSQT